MQIMINVPFPRLGQKIYVPTIGSVVGGLGTISMAVGHKIFIKESPDLEFDWLELVRNQLNYVEIYGGHKVAPRYKRAG